MSTESAPINTSRLVQWGGGAILLAIVAYFTVPLLDSGRVKLEAFRDQVNVNGDGPPLYFPRLRVINKGLESITVSEVQFNNRADCKQKANAKLAVGDTYGALVTCGQLVRATVRTDRGDFDFTW